MISFKKYKKLTYIITTFTLIVFTFSIVLSILVLSYKNKQEVNNISNLTEKYFKFNDSNNITFREVCEIVDNYNNSQIYLEYEPLPKYLNNDTIFGRGIYFKNCFQKSFPILEGRDFTKEEIENGEKVALVGVNFKDEVFEENNERFFTIGEEKFKVSGILGRSERQTGYDNTFLFNLKSSDEFSDTRSSWKINIENNEALKNILNEYKKLAVNKNTSFSLEDIKKDFNLKEALNEYKDFIDILFLVFIIGILNLIIAIYYWIKKSIKEMGVRKAYGASNGKIVIHILKQYLISICIALIMGVSLHLLLKRLLIYMFPEFTFDVYYQSIIFITIIFMFIGLIAVLIPLFKAKKVKPINIMKGKLK